MVSSFTAMDSTSRPMPTTSRTQPRTLPTRAEAESGRTTRTMPKITISTGVSINRTMDCMFFFFIALTPFRFLRI